MHHCKCIPLDADFIYSAGDATSPKKKQFAIKIIKKPRKTSGETDIKPYEPIDISECDHEVIDRELELIEIDKIRKNYFREKARENKKRKMSLNASTQSSNFEGS
jgi:hypothetical protein